jgi:hypothetical protein
MESTTTPAVLSEEDQQKSTVREDLSMTTISENVSHAKQTEQREEVTEPHAESDSKAEESKGA